MAGIASLILTVGIVRFSYTPMFPLMKEQTDLNDTVGGWLAVINYIGYFTGTLIVMYLKNITQRFYFYRISLIIAVFTTIGMGLTTNQLLWNILRFLSGISSVAGYTLASGLILHWLTQHKLKKELGLHFCGIGLGIVLSGIIFVLFEKTLSWDKLWIAYGMFGVLFFIPAWFWLPKPIINEPIIKNENKLNRTNVMLGIAPKRWLVLMLVIYFCAGFGYVISATFIVDMFKQLGTFQEQSIFIWIIVGLAAIPSTYLWDRIARKITHINTLIFAYLLQIISFLIPALSEGLILNIMGAIFFGSTSVGIVSLMLTFVGNKYSQNPAEAMAKLTLTYGIAQIVGPLISVYFVEKTGSYTAILLITTVIVSIGLALLFRLNIHEKN